VIGEPTPDTSTIQSNLTAFVTEYNSVLSDLESRLSDQPVANPQTAADFAQGALFNDQGLETLVSSLRNAFSDSMSTGGAYSTLAQVGVSTGAAVGSGSISQDSLNGMLTVDAGTFSTALATNFDAVKALFTNATGKYATEGIGQRLDTILNQYTEPSSSGGYLANAIDGETSSITELQGEVSDWQQRLALKQQNYETEFTNMETALSQTQSVGAELSSQISSL
jgi:flagellar hook-associated protein 2